MGIQRRPAPAAASYLPDEEEEEILAPVVRKARIEDDDDEAPSRSVARRRATQAADEDEDERPGARIPRQRQPNEDDLEEEDEDSQPPTNSRVAAGWGAAKALQSEGGDYTAEFKLSEDGALIKFLEDAPVAVYRQHFLREKDGKKSYICLGSGCPLCDELGHNPDKKFAFNVVDLSQDTWGVSLLVAGPRLLGILEKHNSGKYGPLDRHYWEISRSGTGQKTTYNLSVVKDRYLEDEYGHKPAAVEAVVRKLKPLTADAIRQSTRAELRQIVAELDS